MFDSQKHVAMFRKWPTTALRRRLCIVGRNFWSGVEEVVCPFCVSATEYLAADLAQHILAHHPKEATVATAALPIAVAMYKGAWPVVIGLFILVVILLAYFQDRGHGFGWA